MVSTGPLLRTMKSSLQGSQSVPGRLYPTVRFVLNSTNTHKKIKNELSRVERIIRNIDINVFLSREYKDDLEWWTLGKIVVLLENSDLTFPVFAEKRNPPDPDFITYASDHKFYKYVEVTEVLNPQRYRSHEYANKIERKVPNKPNIELIESLKTRIKQKLNMKYGADSWLFIYFNMTYSNLSLFGNWERLLLFHVTQWLQKKEIDFSNCSYERIFVTNSSGKALIQIYPNTTTIIPENNEIAKQT